MFDRSDRPGGSADGLGGSDGASALRVRVQQLEARLAQCLEDERRAVLARVRERALVDQLLRDRDTPDRSGDRDGPPARAL